MRYSISGATVETVRQAGGADIREARHSGVVFATLDEPGAARLRALGCTVTPVDKVTTTDVVPPHPVEAVPVYTPASLLALIGFDAVRELFHPPLSGEGINVAVVDTGIRESHEQIRGGIIYRKNFTGSPMADDFDHGTGVAAVVRALAPECGLLNIKALDAKGEGTEEELTLAIDDLIDYHSNVEEITIINLSLGSPDDGNPYNPVRVVCREAARRGIHVLAAAGNSGPYPGTIMNPATEKDLVGAIGSVGFDAGRRSFYISGFSSRGPTLEGVLKPDYVMFGENIITASSASDTATVAKSGTSFSCPMASGVGALSLEAYARKAGFEIEQYPEIAETIKWAYEQMLHPTNAAELYIPRITVKPQGVSPGKDNDYGWGLPFGPLMIQAITREAAPPAGISDLLAPLMTIGVLGMLTATMARAMR